jgi:hypothetical protein
MPPFAFPLEIRKRIASPDRRVLNRERIWVFNANAGVLLQGNMRDASLAEAAAQYEALIA